jgi:hypothetical protein
VHNCSVLVGEEENTVVYVESQWHDGDGIRRWKVKGRRWSVCGTFMSVRSSEGVSPRSCSWHLSMSCDVTAVEPSRSSHSTPLRKTAATTVRTIRTTSREYACVYSCIGYVFDNTLEAQNAFLKVHTAFYHHNTTSIDLRNSFI